MFRKAFSLVLLVSVLSGCIGAGEPRHSQKQSEPAAQAAVSANSVVEIAAPLAKPEVLPTAEGTAPKAAPALPPTVTPTQPSANAPLPAEAPAGAASVSLGPDNFPSGINPLTGLPVKDSATLSYSPALVSITNFPKTARPQAGLSFSPYVFEMYIGEGMTRFLALFYGDYPQKGASTGIALDDDKVGPVRSGRLPYESLRKLYNGFLVMASASPNVLTGLNSYNNVFGSDTSDINSAMVPATKLAEIASQNPKRLEKEALSGQKFDSAPPAAGKLAKMIWIPFSFLNQVIWRYDAASGAYLRYQDDADGKTFIQATDRLNQQPLTYENVVVLFAAHDARKETLININFMYVDKLPALLFRDGKMYEIYWTTANRDYEKSTGLLRPIRFIDAQGNPFPLKPGQTWVEVVQTGTRYNETVASETYFELKNKQEAGSGNWAIHFFPTVPEK